ncbi:MAG TPA: thioredoxin family protein [Thermoanaerobaculia bacterium]|nr:thioredoxin family protein [Thermoanaerobaculia bacterium]
MTRLPRRETTTARCLGRRAAPPALATLVMLATGALALGAGPARGEIRRPEKARFVLNADRTAYEAGATAQLAALVSIDSGWHVNSNRPTYDYLIPTALELALPSGWPKAAVKYPAAKKKSFAFADEPLSVFDGEVVIAAAVAVPADAAKGLYPIQAQLRYQACNDSQCLPPVTTQARIQLAVGPGGKPVKSAAGPAAGANGPDTAPRAGGPEPMLLRSATARPSVATAGAGNRGTGSHQPAAAGADSRAAGSLGVILLLAALGGLVLNAMPCVLPVLSLKVFGMLRSAGAGRSGVVRGALATAAGILVSFWALAGAAIAAAAAGAAVGWGTQFQRPGFVALLAVVIVLFSLNLWGLFEIRLPMTLARLGGSGPREGLAGHFASGLFATIMATPCSAPFLGTAVGFALAQPPPTIFAVFTAVGLGMSLPYLLLAAAPGVARLLPKPGDWMETLRGALGFLLAGAAVWLLYVLSAQVSPARLAAIELALVGVALFAWVRHRAFAAPALRRTAGAGLVAAAAFSLGLAAWSGAGASGHGDGRAAGRPAGLIAWVSFDRARAESLRSQGQLVFVDVTADWCFTCKVNERLILDTPEVARAFAEHNVLPMRADWTNRNDEIARFLSEHGRYGIPFYLLYRPGTDPYVFSELPSIRTLVNAVREADGKGKGV